MFSSSRAPAVSVYPDSDKILVGLGPDREELVFKRSTAVQWSEGEQAGRRPLADRSAPLQETVRDDA